jgi:hypothetical protein
MAIQGYDKKSFGTRLNELLFASQPIHSIEYLFGRSEELDKIEKALFAPGRHVFIHGDRGVGKSSLAATAASQYQDPNTPYIDISCGPDSSLRNVVANIAYKAIDASRLYRVKEINYSSHELRFLKAALSIERAPIDLSKDIKSLADCVEILREVSLLHSMRPIVVLDEFDRIQDGKERHLFADLLKHLGDKRIPIKFLFTGVAKSLDELLGAHQSANRQLEAIELPKLSWTARWDIVLKATQAFNLTIEREIYIRIAAVCDGYPYYAHFITEKVLWSAFDDPEIITEVTWGHYHAGLRHAIESVDAELKRPYLKAVNKRGSEYEEILWATADSEYLERFAKSIYSSYEYITKQRRGSTLLPYDKFVTRLRKLKEDSFGGILVTDPNHPGLYTYREKMLRGYVRMQAEAHDIELAGEKIEQSVRQKMRVPTSAGRGYFTSKPPPGIHFGRDRSHSDDDDGVNPTY